MTVSHAPGERGLRMQGIINKPLRAASLRQILQAVMA